MNFENYDIPKAGNGSTEYDSPKYSNDMKNNTEETAYDLPKPRLNALYQTDTFSYSSKGAFDTLSCSSSSHSSFNLSTDYDIPRRVSQQASQKSKLPATLVSSFSTLDVYDVPTSQQLKEHPLDISSSLKRLNDLQGESNQAIHNLLIHVKVSWREPEHLEPILEDLKSGTTRLKLALQSLLEFVKCVYINTCKLETSEMSIKLKPLLTAMQNAFNTLSHLSNELEATGWTVSALSRNDNIKGGTFDNLDQLIACAQTLTEDIRHCVSFIQGNAILIFNKDGGHLKSTATDEGNFEYDYVSFENKDGTEKKSSDINRARGSEDPSKIFELLNENRKSAVMYDDVQVKDKEQLLYYMRLVIPVTRNLSEAIDVFLETVERNQPPKIFANYVKLILASGHSLISYGDKIHNLLTTSSSKSFILTCINALSAALKQGIVKTKRATQNYPSINAVQEMVDSIVNISHLANCLKLTLLKLVKQVLNKV